MKKNKLTAVLIALALLVLALPLISLAAEDDENEGTNAEFTYTINADGSVTITGLSREVTHLAIPATIGGRPVGKIADRAFFGMKTLRRLYFAEGVSVIGKSAFEGCTSLENFSLPESITQIGESAFAGCDALEYIILPSGLVSLGKDAFSGCGSLELIVVKNAAENAEFSVGCFSGNSAVVCAPKGSFAEIRAAADNVPFSTVSAVDDFKYARIGTGTVITGYTGGAVAVIIPDEIDGYPVTGISEDAFSPESGMAIGAKIIILPDSVRSIGFSAFSGSEQLMFVIMPEKLNDNIVKNAFRGCTSLREIVIPEGVKEIGAEAFYSCTSLRSVVFPETLEYISQGAFRDCVSLSEITSFGSEPETRYKNSLPNRVSFAGVEGLTVYAKYPSEWKTEDGLWYANGKSSEYIGYRVTEIDCPHFFIEEIEVQTSCHSEGVTRFYCPFCRESYTETYPKIPHTYKSMGVVEGIETFRCIVCGESYMKFHFSYATIKPIIDTSRPKGEMMADLIIAFRGEPLQEGVDFSVVEEYSEQYERVELTFTPHGEFIGTRKLAYYVDTGNFAEAHTVFFEEGKGGGLYFPGDLVTVMPGELPEGYEVGSWIVTGASIMSQSKIAAVFEMPKGDVTVSFNSVPISTTVETETETQPPETEPITEPITESKPAHETTTSPRVMTTTTGYNPPDNDGYMRRAAIWGTLLFLSLAAMIAAGIFMFKKGDGAEDEADEK